MKRGIFFLNLFGGLALSGLSLLGFALLRHRPGFPSGIGPAAVIQVEGDSIQNADELNFVLSQKSIGDKVKLVLRTSRGTEPRDVQLVPYYSRTSYPLIYLIIGLINLSIGMFVFLRKPGDRLARIFYWCAVAFSYAIIVSGEFLSGSRTALTFLPGLVFNILYPLAPALLVHFSLALARQPRRRDLVLVYGPSLLLATAIEGLCLGAVLNRSLALLRLELRAVYVFRWYIVVAIAFSLAILVRRFRRSEVREERAQVLWIFFGLALGLSPFMLLYQLPRLLGLTPLLSEDITSVFYIAIPVAFAIAIIEFKLMRIELVINRSLVYALLTILIVSLYLVGLEAVRVLFARFFQAHQTLTALAVTVTLAAAFQPARRRIQDFVDKSFFRQSYDARRAVLRFSEIAQTAADADALAGVFENELAGVLPVENFQLALYDLSRDAARPRLFRGSASIINEMRPCLAGGQAVLARRAALHSDQGVNFSREPVLEQCRIDLALSVPFHNPALEGFAALGRKRSGERFRAEDLDLVVALLAELALHFERIKLQEEVIYERASREKLDELNRLKTEFVSSVSHELRTPLTSLQGLVEILQSGRAKNASSRDRVLEIMAGESRRLSRLLHNILDYGRIEQKVRVYDLRPTALQPVVENAVKLFRVGGEGRDFAWTVNLPPQPLILNLDQDAVEQALINLIDNAIKYSRERKEIEVRVVEKGRDVRVQVRDWGIGISPQERDRIFDTFYRTAEASRHNPQGVGLGLKIVKHIMDAHGGAVQVEPARSRGTVFSLVFPKP
jgi:signal transduction histidine kinase